MSDKHIERIKLHQAISTLIFVGLLIIIAIILLHPREQKWTAIYYPSINDLHTYSSGSLGSIEACRVWVQGEARKHNDENYDYECGLNCRIDEDASESVGDTMYICKETTK